MENNNYKKKIGHIWAKEKNPGKPLKAVLHGS